MWPVEEAQGPRALAHLNDGRLPVVRQACPEARLLDIEIEVCERRRAAGREVERVTASGVARGRELGARAGDTSRGI